MQRTQVCSLVGELGFHALRGAAKEIKKDSQVRRICGEELDRM